MSAPMSSKPPVPENDSAAMDRQLLQVLESTPDCIVMVDRAWNFSFVNQRAYDLLGETSLVGRNLFEVYPGNLDEPFHTTYRDAMDRRIAGEFEAFYPAPLSVWFKVRARPLDDGIVIFFSDITRRREAELREQETASRLSQVLEVTSDAIFSCDRKWRFTFINRHAHEFMGGENRLGQNLLKEFPITQTGDFWKYYSRAMNERIPGQFEAYYPDPINKWFAVEAQPSQEGMVVFFRDVTPQREFEKVTREQQGLLAVVQRNARMAAWALDLKTNRLAFGLGSYPVYGYPFAEIAAIADFLDKVHPDDQARVTGQIADASAKGENFVIEFRMSQADASVIWIESRGHVEMAGGAARYLRGISLDITERKANEERLATSEERYRVLADLNPQAIWMGDAAGNITYANQGFLAYIGLTVDSLNGEGWLDAFHPVDRDRVVQVWTESVTTGADYKIEVQLRKSTTGEYCYWELRAAPVRDPKGAILYWLGVGNDIHEAKTYAATLRAEQVETERRNAEIEAIYKTTPIGLSLHDPVDFRFLSLNDHEAEILGLPKDEILGKRLEEIAPIPSVLELFRKAALGEVFRDQIIEGELTVGERRAWSVNYTPVFNADGSVRAISSSAIEITQQRKAEAALIQSEKLAAVGRLASSISHEINNPLEAITNLLYLIAHDPALPDAMKVYVHMAQSELSRVSQIATQTLRFHRQSVAPTPVTAEELAGAVVRLYTGRLANSHIRVDAHYGTDTKILCFENDIRQVLNNLIANAIDAMRTGGRLIVRAHEAHEPAGEQRAGVRITIADTGHGMSPEVMSRIFEPFYTTKDLNGTGLGLWISSGIVDRHQGRLKVRSSQDPIHHGTIFTLFLPCKESGVV